MSDIPNGIHLLEQAIGRQKAMYGKTDPYAECPRCGKPLDSESDLQLNYLGHLVCKHCNTSREDWEWLNDPEDEIVDRETRRKRWNEID